MVLRCKILKYQPKNELMVCWNTLQHIIISFSFPTAPSGPPLNFTASPLDPRTLELTWSPPASDRRNGLVRGYRLIVLSQLDGTVELNTTTVGQRLMVADLHPDYTYMCSVSAFTVGLGPAATSTVQLLEDSEYIYNNRGEGGRYDNQRATKLELFIKKSFLFYPLYRLCMLQYSGPSLIRTPLIRNLTNSNPHTLINDIHSYFDVH